MSAQQHCLKKGGCKALNDTLEVKEKWKSGPSTGTQLSERIGYGEIPPLSSSTQMSLLLAMLSSPLHTKPRVQIQTRITCLSAQLQAEHEAPIRSTRKKEDK